MPPGSTRVLPGGPPCTDIASWSADGAFLAIDVIAKDVESIVGILDINGDYDENDFVKQEPGQTWALTSSAGKARNPVRRPPGRERTPRASAQARDTDRVAGIAEGRPNGRPAQRPAHPAGRGLHERSRSSKACCVTSVADINRGVQPRTVANPRSMDEPTDPSGRVVREGGAHAYGQGAWRLLQAVDGCSLDRTCEPSLAVPTRGRSETLRPHR